MATGAPAGQRVKTADLLIAALAVQRGVGVPYYDSDYDVIRHRGGEPFDSEWLAPRGSLETAQETPRTLARSTARPSASAWCSCKPKLTWRYGRSSSHGWTRSCALVASNLHSRQTRPDRVATANGSSCTASGLCPLPIVVQA